MRVLVLALAALSLQASEVKLTEEMWNDIRPVYATIMAHPFFKELADGTLPRRQFEFFLMEDDYFLAHFESALDLLAIKAPRQDWAITLKQHALNSKMDVLTLYHRLAPDALCRPNCHGGAAMAVTFDYSIQVVEVAEQRPFAYGLAALLPRYWIHLEVGKKLSEKGSKNPTYQEWINTNASEAHAKELADVITMMNTAAPKLDPASRRAARERFRISASYELAFLEMAWREEKWLP